MLHFITYLSTVALFSVIDTAWLSAMGAKTYRPLMGDILLQDFRVAPAVSSTRSTHLVS